MNTLAFRQSTEIRHAMDNNIPGVTPDEKWMWRRPRSDVYMKDVYIGNCEGIDMNGMTCMLSEFSESCPIFKHFVPSSRNILLA